MLKDALRSKRIQIKARLPLLLKDIMTCPDNNPDELCARPQAVVVGWLHWYVDVPLLFCSFGALVSELRTSFHFSVVSP